MLNETELKEYFKANSYPIGSVVKFSEEYDPTGVYAKDTQLIKEVVFDAVDENGHPYFMYATTLSAWHNHADLKLVSLPTSESYKLIARDN